jgi:hypothetical protein
MLDTDQAMVGIAYAALTILASITLALALFAVYL